jgi:hypothetical protein
MGVDRGRNGSSAIFAGTVETIGFVCKFFHELRFLCDCWPLRRLPDFLAG